ncbi:Fc.00g105150.m01.CDS01 [Cosmosporella sp. VM-42]
MTTDTPITVAIAGITGSLGRLITEYLLAKPNIRIRGLCRTPSKLPESIRADTRLIVHTTSSTDIAALRAAVSGADVAICCYLGPHSLMVDGQKLLIDACIAEGVPRYIAGDWSMDFRKLELGQHPPKDPMKLVQAYLEDKEAFEHIKAVHVLNACFLERPWVGIWDGKNNVFKYWGTGDERWEFTTYRNAAQFTAEVAVDKHAVGWLSFRGDQISIKEIAKEFQAVYNQEPGLLRLGSLEDLYTLMHETRDKDPADFKAWLGLFYTYYSINGQTCLPLPLDNARYPAIKLITVRDFFAKTPKERLGKFGILQS